MTYKEYLKSIKVGDKIRIHRAVGYTIESKETWTVAEVTDKFIRAGDTTTKIELKFNKTNGYYGRRKSSYIIDPNTEPPSQKDSIKINIPAWGVSTGWN